MKQELKTPAKKPRVPVIAGVSPYAALYPKNRVDNTYRGLGDKRVIVELTDKVKEKILYLCKISPDKEWSGIIFYDPEGTLAGDADLRLVVKDFYLQDFGETGSTTFTQDEDLAHYMCLHDEIFNCKTGLMHSHNRMDVFFSTTDIEALYMHARSFGILLSIVVNNAGKVIATLSINDKGGRVTRVTSLYADFDGKTVNASPMEEKTGNPVPILHDCETKDIEVPQHEDAEFMENIKQVKGKQAVLAYSKSRQTSFNYDGDYYPRNNVNEDMDDDWTDAYARYNKYGTL
jgi:hypothetical protein